MGSKTIIWKKSDLDCSASWKWRRESILVDIKCRKKAPKQLDTEGNEEKAFSYWSDVILFMLSGLSTVCTAQHTTRTFVWQHIVENIRH